MGGFFVKFPNAANGVSKIYTAEILGLIGVACLLVSAIIAVIGVVTESAAILGSLPFIIAYGVLAIISFILQIVGINKASKDDAKFKNAFVWLIIAIIAAGAQGAFAESNEAISSLFQAITNVANLLVTVYVLQGCISLAKQLGNSDVEAMGNKTIKMIIISYAIILAMLVITIIFGLIGKGEGAAAIIVAILGIAVAVVSIIAYIIYLKTLSRAKKMLNE